MLQDVAELRRIILRFPEFPKVFVSNSRLANVPLETAAAISM